MRYGIVLAAMLALAGCSDQEVGSSIDQGFGNTTMNNTLSMTGQRDMAINLTRKFASDVPNTVHFAFNSATLDPTAMAALDQQARWIKQFPEVRFRVYGHTDLVGSDSYNRALGLQRAKAVVSYLTAQGISRSRLEAVVSYGKTQPLVYVPGPNLRNRRTVTEVSGFVRTNPTLLNGKYAAVIFREYVKSASPTASNTVTNQTKAGSATGG